LIIDIGRRRRLQPFDNESGMPAAKGASYVTVVKLTPERFVGARQDLDVALSAINALPENCRRAFMLQRTTGMKYADVATALGMSESMVQKHMARALVELHKVLPD
jgi:RNA polymerase sigma-70 factor (ECF subfamily)